MNPFLGYVLRCQQCNSVFVICKRCFRGHKYCGDVCRKKGYAAVRKRARLRHESSLEAKLDHRDRSRRHRAKLREDTVTDQSSTSPPNPVNPEVSPHLEQWMLPRDGICTSCGKILWAKKGVSDG